MGIVINQRVILNAAYNGRPVIGMAFFGKSVWRINLDYIRFDPDKLRFDNDAYQQNKAFLVIATGDWEIEELL